MQIKTSLTLLSLALALPGLAAAATTGASDPLAAPVVAQTTVDYADLYDAKKAWAAARERIRALGMTEIDHGDGTYSYGLPSTLETPETRTVNGVVWRYDGQAVFDRSGAAHGPVALRQDDTPANLTLGEKLLGSVSIDLYGRRWVAVDSDPAAVAKAVAAYDAEVAARFGLEPDHDGARFDRVEAYEPAEAGTFHPHTWFTQNCDADSDIEISRYDSDNRTLSATPMTSRQEKSVLLLLYADDRTFSCSGTMVDDEWALTAAHCITRDNGNFYNSWSMRACTHGNYGAHDSGSGDTATCHWVNLAVKPGSYSGDGDFSDDYAVVRLSTKPTQIGWMAISSASNSTIKNADSWKAGYPAFAPGCGSNSPSPQVSGVTARRQYKMDGDLFGTTSKRIKTRLDAGTGESGSAFFYYPSGCCGSHYITGVLAGFVDVGVGSDYTGGPKGSAIRDWVSTNTP